ncbi:UNVERIFIED_ORG: hypothetical protein BDK47_13115 [Anoxybacillus amylolyticus]|uniref:Uncharacterized protein n=2 Tax=Geobacillus thermoleovorans group TaxID=1505648 RepID=U2X3T4_GEOKU|nr:hypothetical protein GTCCBUS3UF5_16330 [Geobacillus thermoleovorans CCB_US3_UF5]EQB94169.1 hypothetical protein GA8_18445 [Geobacillus sp. A8]GAD13430.1 hypothetical protein GBL_1647 [Geobacillus kaustophilus GBlys]GAJ59241.1 hypothetical protein B23_2465 [Geobacillus thermoleovorans B23]
MGKQRVYRPLLFFALSAAVVGVSVHRLLMLMGFCSLK